ncbi:hydroxylamine oxidation protein HaoB [Comamonas flocculans]|uniref:Hydroxylamine oxidation protein HaoB n=1 Tax=Comamonas flocculans TaxID=2597701 RepID=A0A5B8S0F9_9BURK|nr:hydroxylamine oxidation protein HaoB [Comamonas flocculans]QEA14115.1 hydroxylamine oxidation protein HaoB [Comamonas flocculans]
MTRQRPLVARLAIVGGLVLIAAAALLLWRHASAPPIYHYVVGETLPASDAGALSAYAEAGYTLRRASVQAPERDTPLATLDIAETSAGPLLVNWQARVDDPFLTLAVPPEDVAALAQVLKRHVSGDATVLAWWDSSRQFKTLAGVDVNFASHLGLPLFVPAHWSGSRASVEAIERSFWSSGDAAAAAGERERFRRFGEALVSPEAEGIAALRALAGEGKRVVLVLHWRDVILLGQMFPDKLGVAFQDFGATNDVHGMVRRVHAWLQEHKYTAYGVLQGGGQPLRAIALTDEPSGNTLAARLLPFMGNAQHDVQGATLVYQTGGFSVYEIAPAGDADAAVRQAQEG